jgi:hypothetical protein
MSPGDGRFCGHFAFLIDHFSFCNGLAAWKMIHKTSTPPLPYVLQTSPLSSAHPGPPLDQSNFGQRPGAGERVKSRCRRVFLSHDERFHQFSGWFGRCSNVHSGRMDLLNRRVGRLLTCEPLAVFLLASAVNVGNGGGFSGRCSLHDCHGRLPILWRSVVYW